jgi:hypothetical protein
MRRLLTGMIGAGLLALMAGCYPATPYPADGYYGDYYGGGPDTVYVPYGSYPYYPGYYYPPVYLHQHIYLRDRDRDHDRDDRHGYPGHRPPGMHRADDHFDHHAPGANDRWRGEQRYTHRGRERDRPNPRLGPPPRSPEPRMVQPRQWRHDYQAHEGRDAREGPGRPQFRQNRQSGGNERHFSPPAQRNYDRGNRSGGERRGPNGSCSGRFC